MTKVQDEGLAGEGSRRRSRTKTWLEKVLDEGPGHESSVLFANSNAEATTSVKGKRVQRHLEVNGEHHKEQVLAY